MANTPNLNLTLLQSAQAQKDVTANAAFTSIDAFAGFAAIGVVNGSQTLSAATAGAGLLILTGALTAAATVIIPSPLAKISLVINLCTGGQVVTVQNQGDAGVTVPYGALTPVWSGATQNAGTRPQTTLLTLSVAGGTNVTLTDPQAANRILQFTGALTANIEVIVPPIVEEWIVFNNTTGTYTLTVTTAGGTGVTVGQNSVALVYGNGTNVVNASAGSSGSGVTSLNSLSGALNVAAGTGIGVSASGSSVTVANNGVTSLNGDTGALTIAAGSNVSSIGNSSGTLTVNVSANRLLYANTSIPSGDTLTGLGLGANTFGAFGSSYTLPANSLVAGTVLDIWIAGVYSSDATTPGTVTLEITLGGVVLFTCAGSMGASQTNAAWSLSGRLTVLTTGSSGTLEAQGWAICRGQFNAMSNTTAISINTTTAETLVAQVKLSSALSTNTYTLRQFVVELLE